MENYNNLERRKIYIAKEIKQNIKFLFFAFFISLISIPIISWRQIEIYQLKMKFDKVKTTLDSPEYIKVTDEIEIYYDDFVARSLGCVTIKEVEPYEFNGSIFTGKEIWNYNCLFNNEDKVFQMDRVQKYFNVFIISFFVLVLFRYLFFALRWVNRYSKKDI